MDTLPETVPDAKAKTPLDTQGNIKREALMDRLADTLKRPRLNYLQTHRGMWRSTHMSKLCMTT